MGKTKKINIPEKCFECVRYIRRGGKCLGSFNKGELSCDFGKPCLGDEL